MVDEVVRAWWVPWVVGVLLPIMLIFGVAFLKKLVRGGPSMALSDFYQGIELSWAVLGATILYVYDLLRLLADNDIELPVFALDLVRTVMLIGVTLTVTLIIAILHQMFEGSAAKGMQFCMLGVVCNLAGLALFVWFVVGIKGA